MQEYVMFEILETADISRAESAMADHGLTGYRLMQNAGREVARVVMDVYNPCPVLVLCGGGNNGGDGFVAATVLADAGWDVRVACLTDRKNLKGDAARAAKDWGATDKARAIESLNSNLSVHKTGLIVDAVFGHGFRDTLAPETVTLFDKIRTRRIPVIAVDLPSGIDAGGRVIDPHTLTATHTVTFERRKPAHMLYPARRLCGRLHIRMIGITDDVIAGLGTSVFANDPALWVRDFPLPDAETHKYMRGHTVVYGGTAQTGAARLAAAAAARAGSGAVTIACTTADRALYAATASIMTETRDTTDDFKSILRDSRKNVLVAGNGAIPDAQLAADIDAALSFNKTVVFDAGALRLYQNNPTALFARLSPDRHILTPHMGEFDALFGAGEKGRNKIDRARAAAQKSNAIVLLKGGDTVIAAPDGAVVVHSFSPATLATAGSGDVLAGLVAGFAAQGMNLFMAAAAAVWIQGKAARCHGLGLVAEDIISNIPQALNDLFMLNRQSDDRAAAR